MTVFRRARPTNLDVSSFAFRRSCIFSKVAEESVSIAGLFPSSGEDSAMTEVDESKTCLDGAGMKFLMSKLS